MRRHATLTVFALLLGWPLFCPAQLSGGLQFNFTNGPALWDFSGDYALSNETFRLENRLVHATSGSLTGTGGAHYDDGLVRVNAGQMLSGRVTRSATSRISAKAKGSGQFSGSAFGTPISGPFSASLALTLDPTNRILFGTETAMICIQGRGCRTLSTNVSFQLPDDVNGTWALSLNITTSNNVVRGAAVAQLANGRTLSFTVRGRYLPATGLSRLTLFGTGEAFGRRLAVRLDGAGTLQALNGNLFGQRLAFP